MCDSGANDTNVADIETQQECINRCAEEESGVSVDRLTSKLLDNIIRRVARTAYQSGYGAGLAGLPTTPRIVKIAPMEMVAHGDFLHSKGDSCNLCLAPPPAPQPACLGFPKCDGNLPGEPHEPECPLCAEREAKLADWLRQRDQEHARPVAWRVKDFADGWILCATEKQAIREAASAGNLVQPLFTRSAQTSTLLSELLQAAKDVVRLWQGTSTKIALNRAMADFCTAVEKVEKARKDDEGVDVVAKHIASLLQRLRAENILALNEIQLRTAAESCAAAKDLEIEKLRKALEWAAKHNCCGEAADHARAALQREGPEGGK